MLSIAVDTPIGTIGVMETNGAITRIDLNGPAKGETSTLLDEAAMQLQAYFAGELKHFDLPLAPRGSSFQQAVYEAMYAIPFGETRTYGELAEQVNGFAQAVGQACGSNPIPIIIPCHRVLAANGLGGYSGFGGLETKIKLLQMEDAYPYLL